jgi:eukaryotic-like serine/threonine-protein kinase
MRPGRPRRAGTTSRPMLIQTELRFERRANLGLQGLNSEVFLAFDRQLNAELVVKQVKKPAIADPAAYFAEAAQLYDARHPNVVDVKYACSDADHIYLAMPRYARSVHSVLQQRALRVYEIVRLGLDLLSGLHHVHSKGLIHFDVKPSNVLIDWSDHAAVADFGLTRPVDVHGLATPDQIYNRHVPPEYLGVSTALSTSADVFQAGLTLYRMCVGLNFFDWQFQRAVSALGPNWTAAVLAGQFPSRSDFPAHIPPRLRSLVARALEVDPANRFRSALEMSNELAKVNEHLHWQFLPAAGVLAWELTGAEHLRRVALEPDDAKQKVTVTRTHLPTGKITNLTASLGGQGLTNSAADKTIRFALATLETANSP